MEILVIWLICWCLLAWWGYTLGKHRGRPVAGVVLGFVLGLIGIIIIAVMPETEEHKVAKVREALRLQAIASSQLPPWMAGPPSPPPAPPWQP